MSSHHEAVNARRLAGKSAVLASLDTSHSDTRVRNSSPYLWVEYISRTHLSDGRSAQADTSFASLGGCVIFE